MRQFQEKCEVKHGVSTTEVAEVLLGSPRFNFAARGIHQGDDLYAPRGQTDAGPLGFVGVDSARNASEASAKPRPAAGGHPAARP